MVATSPLALARWRPAVYGQLAFDIATTILTLEITTQTHRDVAAKTRGARLEARISVEQKALFQQAATLSARTLSEFVVASAHRPDCECVGAN